MVELGMLPQAEVQQLFALTGIPPASVEDLDLLLIVPMQRDLSADGASVAPGSPKAKLDPLPTWSDAIQVDDQRALVVGDNDVHRAVAVQVGRCHRPSVIAVEGTHSRRDVVEAPAPIAQKHPGALVSRPALVTHGR